jgi:mono/diheme cytochrome c family protein
VNASTSGREVFARDCSFCHSISGHNSPKQQGGDLLRAHLRRPVLIQFTAEMPVRHRLTRHELHAVVDYVLAVQRQGG